MTATLAAPSRPAATPRVTRTSRPVAAPDPTDPPATLLIGQEVEDLLFREARSASSFTDEPVTDEQLATIWDLVRFGPTAFNEQPLRIVSVRSAAARRRLGRHLHGHNQVRAENAPLTVVLAADLNFHEKLDECFPHAPQLQAYYAQASVAERREQARYNALLQVGYFIIGVRAAGLGAGPMLGFDAEALNRDFFPDGDLDALLVVNLGRPLPKSYERLPRLGFDRVATTL